MNVLVDRRSGCNGDGKSECTGGERESGCIPVAREIRLFTNGERK